MEDSDCNKNDQLVVNKFAKSDWYSFFYDAMCHIYKCISINVIALNFTFNVNNIFHTNTIT